MANSLYISELLMMKTLLPALFFLLQVPGAFAQNIGIGSPAPLQKLDVNGAIKLGNTSQNAPGTIRYTGSSFEGGDGTNWKALEGLPSKAIIIAQEPDTAILKTKGFTVLRQLDIWDTSLVNQPHPSSGAWSPFVVSGGTAPAVGIFSNESVFHNGKLIMYGSNGYLYAYNTVSQVWEQLPGLCPLGDRSGYGITLVGNEVYITGGWRFVNPNFVIYNTAAKYNLSTNTWTAIANMPVNDCYHSSITAGTDIYILNGASTFNGSQFVMAKKLYRYNTTTNTWSGDLATASTPDYLFQGGTIARNGKFLFAENSLKLSSGNPYIGLYDYDPVSHQVNPVNPGAPWPYSYQYQFRNTSLVQTATDKVVVAAYIPDSTNINYNPGNPNATSANLMLLYEVNLTTSISTQLSSCGTMNNSIALWQYSPNTGQIYAKNNGAAFISFNPGGSSSCSTVLQRRGYWSYMKKN
jgi:hypothetical protein